MSNESKRQAREAVAAYHEARLAELIGHVGEAVDRICCGELAAFETDQIILQYSRAAKGLWMFCKLTGVVFTAEVIGERAPADCWERGAPKRH